MCGRAAVIRRGLGMARVVGARRIIHDKHSAPGATVHGPKGTGFFRDAGAAHGHTAAHDDAAPAAAAAAAASSSFPDVTKEKQATHGQAEQLLPSHSTATTTTTTEARPTAEVNYNCGPTSTVPVWRLQTAEEQRELLKLEKDLESAHVATPALVKEELDELTADATQAASTHHSIQSVPVIQYMSWGFKNPLAGRRGDDGPIRSHVFNARSESVDEKRMFRELVHKKRCVVLVDGFYEWHTEYSNQTGEPAKKQGYFFHMQLSGGQAPTISIKKQAAHAQTDESPFPVMYLAALYDAAINDATGETIYNVVVLTCGPSKEMAKIHTRMPVILSHADAQRWVDVDHHSWKEVKPLCKPYEGLGLYAVPAVVNNARNHGVECIEPLDAYNARLKAGGITKFFSPVASPSKGKKSPTPSSSARTKKDRSPSPSASKKDSFFNPHGTPGKSFSRVNPADPGATGGSQEPAVRAPSTVTSDAAEAAEQFVLQKEHEQEMEQEAHAAAAAAEAAGSKRKQPASSSSSSSSTLPLPVPSDDEDWFDTDEESMPFHATVAYAVDVAVAPAAAHNKKARTEEKGAQEE